VCLHKLMNRLGIEPQGGVVSRLSLKYATALHRCEACLSKQLCNSWLERGPDSAGVVPQFCPNQDVLFELQFDQPWITIHGRACLRRRTMPSATNRRERPLAMSACARVAAAHAIEKTAVPGRSSHSAVVAAPNPSVTGASAIRLAICCAGFAAEWATHRRYPAFRSPQQHVLRHRR
jgi:Family of unknown function (DUF6455)